MVRQHAHAPRLQLNGVRIAGTSAAIALHAAVLLLLFAPTQWIPPKTVTVEDTPFLVDLPKPKPIPVSPLPPPVKQTPKPADTAPVTKPAVTQDVVVTSDTGPQVVNTDVTPVIDSNNHQPAIATAELTADVAPAPPYPAFALREGTTGMVILRIRVDAQGRPVEGRIEKSSGSHLLDQTALKFVLARWHFNPAMQAGLPIVSDALVPIAFTLD
jgi:protein TonB